MSVHYPNADALSATDLELGPLRESLSGFDSLRSSLDEDFYRKQGCDVHVHDNVFIDDLDNGAMAYSRHSITDPSVVSNSPDLLRNRLKTRDPTRTRWINIVGWSSLLIDEVVHFHLGNHGCLDLDDASTQMLGGPTAPEGVDEFIWLQTQVWFVGKRARLWSSVRQTRFRMIICLPTMTSAGTLITNFVGPLRVAEEVSNIFTERVLENHPLGRQSLGCAWILAFTILCTMAEQLDFAFEIFDPIDSTMPLSIPKLDDLPLILEKATRLARIDRYLSSLEEFASFFLSVQHLPLSGQVPEDLLQSPVFRSSSVSRTAKFEASRARSKISHEQRLCRTYMNQFQTLIQLIISYSATRITERVDQGSKIAEQFTKIGIVIAGVAGIVSPLSLLTSFYGMNVQEFTSGASISLFDVSKIGLPLFVATFICFVFTAMWVMINPAKTR